MSDSKFAAKSTELVPLTDQAQSFAPSTFAKPDFKLGRVVVAAFNFPKSRRFEGFGKSYTQKGMPDQEGEEQ